MPKLFDAKHFNAEAFKYAVKNVPNTKLDKMISSGALTSDQEIRNVFSTQDGTYYARLAMKGLIGGDPLNYDGETDITAKTTETYDRGIVAFGRANAWEEKDFSYDITGGIDFLDNVAKQVVKYWAEVDQDILLSILAGVFAMNKSTADKAFVEKHTTKAIGAMTAVTLNNAMVKACGDHKGQFSMVFCHSDVATHLENLNLIDYMKYTDAAGITRDLDIATWNGRVVIIDDGMPVKDGEYTTYVLGNGAISYEDIGVKVPYEMDRDPAKNGGKDILYSRQRKVLAPYGISYEKVEQAKLSPTNSELANGKNWAIAATGDNKKFFDHKAIPIARILSKGLEEAPVPTPTPAS